ncbi:MAG TPA: EpsI family protein [Planctomycetaceae bacterium]|jgi:EpsI family protein
MKFLDTTAARLGIAAICIAGTQAAIANFKNRDESYATQASTCDVTAFPLQTGDWTGSDVEVDDRLFVHLGATSMLNRSYQNGVRKQVTVHLSSYPAGKLSLPHSPELCYPGAGWKIESDDWKIDSHNHPYRLMVVEQDGTKAAVAYWYQLGSEVASNRDDLRQAFQKIRQQGGVRPPLVKVIIQAPMELSAADDQTAIEEFGSQVYDWVREKTSGRGAISSAPLSPPRERGRG